MELLAGKTALVSGATSGIGRAIALVFLQHGAKVVGVGTNPEKPASLIAETAQFNDRFFFEPCDVSSKEAIEALFSKFFLRFPTLDILVNNAGITRDGLLMRMSLTDWEAVLDIRSAQNV